MSTVDVDLLGRTVAQLIIGEGVKVLFRDPAAGITHEVSPAAAGLPEGLLPAFAVAGEAIWREATGKGFGLEVAPDQDAFLGYRLNGVQAASFAVVSLAIMEAMAQVSQPGAIIANDLNPLWAAVTERLHQDPPPAAALAPSSSP